jgi:hypothetical protein
MSLDLASLAGQRPTSPRCLVSMWRILARSAKLVSCGRHCIARLFWVSLTLCTADLIAPRRQLESLLGVEALTRRLPRHAAGLADRGQGGAETVATATSIRPWCALAATQSVGENLRWYRTERLMSLRMPAHSDVRPTVLVVAAMLVWPPCFAYADTRNPVVVIVPQVRLPSQQPPAFPRQPAQQWSPPPAMGLTPGVRSPAALCYAGTAVCPLERPELVGKGCTCNTASGLRVGRALIPPVRDPAGKPERTDP